MEIIIFLCGALVGAVIIGFAMLDVMEKPHSGGHAAGRVHHRRSWDELPEASYRRKHHSF